MKKIREVCNYLAFSTLDEVTCPRRIYFPTQNLLSHAESTICKYKLLIHRVYLYIYGFQKWLRGTVGGRKIGKNLQIWLPSKKENANICKIDFPVLCTFTLFNADFCTFLQSLRSEQGMNLLCSLVMLIVISIAFLRTVFDDKVSLSEDKRFSLGYGYLIWV